MSKVTIYGEGLDIEKVVRVARRGEEVAIEGRCKSKVLRSRKIVEDIVEGEKTAYGITTGFGELAHIHIPKEDAQKLQENLVRSHAAGVGKLLARDIVRAIMLIEANSLCRGLSGVRLDVLEMLVGLLNKKISPCIPERGSLGASGDLAPLAHLALVLIGRGEAFVGGKRVSGSAALRRAGLKPLRLQAKEGLALLNGTHVMTGVASLSIHDGFNLAKNAMIASAMSLDALRGTNAAFSPKIVKARPHRGQIAVAETMNRILEGSEILASHRKSDHKVQDAYTLRCIPQVLGATLDTLHYARGVLEIEMNSSTDNPLIFEKPYPGGNFHGQPVALVCDFSKIAIAEIGSFAERRIDRLLDPTLSELPPFLTKHSGLNSGFMIPHYTVASLVSENKILCHPASVDSISVSANQEDHVSMGMNAALKAEEVLRNVETIVAIEFLCSAQGLEFRRPLKSGRGVEAAHRIIRKYVQPLEEDRELWKDINTATSIVRKGEIVEAVEKVCGRLL
jgi:histidine ammonia-lyase